MNAARQGESSDAFAKRFEVDPPIGERLAELGGSDPALGGGARRDGIFDSQLVGGLSTVQIGTTSRTLQRKLAEKGTRFRELRDATLWDAVEKALSIPSLKIEVIALSVGFSDVAAFSKAFRRWKGCSPTRFREVILARSTGTPRAWAKRRSTN
jgi:AraC-like DNA-binding protein